MCSGLFVETITLCIKQVDVHVFSFFSVEWVFVLHLFQNSDPHITDTMSLGVEVMSCCLIKLLRCYIAFVFTESVFQPSVCFTNILDRALEAGDEVNDIWGVTIDWLVYLMMIITCSWCYMINSLDVTTISTSIIFLHTWKCSLRSWKNWGNFCSDQIFSQVFLLSLIGH